MIRTPVTHGRNLQATTGRRGQHMLVMRGGEQCALQGRVTPTFAFWFCSSVFDLTSCMCRCFCLVSSYPHSVGRRGWWAAFPELTAVNDAIQYSKLIDGIGVKVNIGNVSTACMVHGQVVLSISLAAYNFNRGCGTSLQQRSSLGSLPKRRRPTSYYSFGSPFLHQLQ